MSNDKKFSAHEAAQAVLAKTHELLAKSETLRKYETANSPKAGIKYGKLETVQKPLERDYTDYEVKSGKSKTSDQKREMKQVSPSDNPKEEAEGNNNVDGMEPRYEFKDKVAGDLAKEKSQHKMAKSNMHTVVYKSLDKAENPDKDADAELGEKVEHDVEEHFKQNKDAEAKEGHKLMIKPDEKMPAKSEEMEGDKAFGMPALIGSAKLAKFMERKHAKRKAAESQAAVGHEASDAPAPKSPEGAPKSSSAPSKKMME